MKKLNAVRLEKELNNLPAGTEGTITFRHKSLEERAAEYGGKLNLGGELDWKDDPVGEEIW